MTPKQVFVALLLGLTAILPSQAHADVLYTVFNPAAPPFPFTLFIYEAPGFITSDTTVSAVQLNFANPKNTITSVAFLPDSITHPGMSELDVFQSSAPLEQVRYYPLGTFDAVGVTAARDIRTRSWVLRFRSRFLRDCLASAGLACSGSGIAGGRAFHSRYFDPARHAPCDPPG